MYVLGDLPDAQFWQLGTVAFLSTPAGPWPGVEHVKKCSCSG